MESNLIFEGDLLLISTPEGGDLVIEDKLFVCDHQFSTSVYLSLFGGNYDDDGKVKNNKTWWGNLLGNTDKNEKIVSRIQNIIIGLPLSVKNIRLAEQAALIDLKWFKDINIADEIKAEIIIIEKNTINLKIEILKDEMMMFNDSYSLLWGIIG
jgi:phage gp46-like protein